MQDSRRWARVRYDAGVTFCTSPLLGWGDGLGFVLGNWAVQYNPQGLFIVSDFLVVH